MGGRSYFFDVVLWGRQGEAINQFLQKGKTVGVDGELRQDRWQQDGQQRSKIEIVASNVQLLGGSPGQGSSGNGAGSSGQGQNFPAGRGEQNQANDNFADDIPF